MNGADNHISLIIQFSIYTQKNMLKNKSYKTNSKNYSTSNHHTNKPQFRTIQKLRNDSISASQLYQQQLNTHSKTLHMTKSQILSTFSKQEQKQNKIDIRDYVKKMDVKKLGDQVNKKIGCLQAPLSKAESIIKPQALVSSRSLSTSQVKGVDKEGKRTLEELQQKIHNFTEHNMKILKLQRQNMDLSKWQQLKKLFQIDKQIQNLINYFNELKCQLGQQQIHGEKLCDLSKKIEIVETMLASQSAESQLLKLQYFGIKNQRGNTSSFSNKNLYNKAKLLNKQNKPLIYNRDHMAVSKQIMRLSTTTKDNFKKPNKNSYLVIQQKKNSYSLNRQPLPRSSYSAQYFNYGFIPTYSYRPDTLRQSPQTCLGVKASTYQHEYKQRLELLRKINFRELDCFKNKFKTSNISFMNSCKKQTIQLSKKLNNRPGRGKQNDDRIVENRSEVTQKCTSERGFIPFMSMSCIAGFYRTQSQKQFNWKNTILPKEIEDDTIKSEIKDRKLHKLKQTFKKLTRQ